MLKSRRLGNFAFDLETINEHPDVVKGIMGSLIVLHADNSFAKAQVNYTAICDEFDEVKNGEVTPDYEVEYDPETEEVTWIRQ